MADQPKIYPPWVEHREPWMPPTYDERVIYAIRALADGKATEHQQSIAWRWIMYVTGAEGMSYRPGATGARDTDFAEGKRFVGLQIKKMLHPELTPDERPAPQKPKRTR